MSYPRCSLSHALPSTINYLRQKQTCSVQKGSKSVALPHLPASGVFCLLYSIACSQASAASHETHSRQRRESNTATSLFCSSLALLQSLATSSTVRICSAESGTFWSNEMECAVPIVFLIFIIHHRGISCGDTREGRTALAHVPGVRSWFPWPAYRFPRP